jgi:6-pyruvoyltetrahydropterin/6-carboxytetrahydropterin synthase
LACWLASRMREVLKPMIGERLSSIEIGVDENNGQWGYCRLPW